MLHAVNELNSSMSFLIFRPDSFLKVLWDLLGFLIIIYQSTVVPFEIWFNVETDGVIYYIEYAMDVYFWTDIFVCFNTGIYIKGILVMKRSIVIWNYLFGWWMLDIISSFPYTTLLDAIINEEDQGGYSDLSKTPQLLRILKIIRFLRIVRVLKFLKLK